MSDPPALNHRHPPRSSFALHRRCLPNASRHGVMGIVLVALSACGTTAHFVAQPQLAIDRSQEGAQQAIAELFGSETPYTVKLCEADPSSKECRKGSASISATGVGGLFLPLVLHVRGLRVSQARQSAHGLAIDASFLSNADGIPPLCASAHGTVISRDDNTASIHVSNFYCNWMLVGNVLVDTDMSIDRISLTDKSFTGYYKVIFHGTGNVSGSGYYKAVMTPDHPSNQPPTTAAVRPGGTVGERVANQ